MATIFDHPDFDDHEQVIFARNPEARLSAIIAVHSTALGPGAGGVRMQPYPNKADAVADVLKLSRAMSYKNAMAGLPLGGGKSVLLADPRTEKSEALMRALGRAIEQAGGRYLAAEDVGMKQADMEQIALETNHVFGRDPKAGFGGEPSPMTALGVFLSIEACANRKLGRSDLEGLSVAVQGAGAVGADLAKRLGDAGAKVLVADVDGVRAEEAAHAAQGTVVSVDTILSQDVDVLAPSALGGAVNAQTLPSIRAKIICGAANNQLADPSFDHALMTRGILYAPDYVANAGGIINVAHEVAGDYNAEAVKSHVARIPETLTEVFERSEKTSQPPGAVADALARGKIGRA